MLAGCSFFDSKLDTKFYDADEVIGQKLLKRNNCYTYEKDILLFWTTTEIACDEIGAYRYFTPDKQPYNGNIAFKHYSIPYNADFICMGEIEDGYMVNAWRFISPDRFDITGHFSVFTMFEGYAEIDWVGKWTINDYRHNMYYSLHYDTVNRYIVLKKVQYNDNKTDSMSVIQSIHPDDKINVSPFCEHSCSQLRFDAELEYDRETAIYCITSYRSDKRTVTYVSKDLELTFADDHITHAKYLQTLDTTEYSITLAYDSLDRIVKITTFEDFREKEFYRSPKQKHSEIFIHHKEDSTLEKLTPKQYLLPNFDSVVYATKNYCTFTR